MRTVRVIPVMVLSLVASAVAVIGLEMPRPAVASPRAVSVTPPAWWAADSDQDSAFFGFSVGTAGDVNGDGYDDVIGGAYQYDNGQTNEGRAFVYHGSAGGLSPTPDWTAESDQESAGFGRSVASAGDVNGDGFDDVIVGAYQYDNGQTNEGRAFVYHGSVSGLSTNPAWTAEPDQESAWFGYAVASAGDVNADGYTDVIVGAQYYDDEAHLDSGRAFLYLGSATGLSPTPNWTGEANQRGALFGNSVGAAGDVNDDGYADVIVGAYLYDHGQIDEGRAFLFLGSAAGLSTIPDWTAESDQDWGLVGFSVGSAGDVNGDGYADVIAGALGYDNGQGDEGRALVYHGSASGLSTTPDWTVESNQWVAQLGYSVGTAGDVNGDGYDDVIVGVPQYDHEQEYEGGALVFQGSASGLSITPDRTAQSDQDFAIFGRSVGTAGDVNGDGYAEVIVGADQYDNGQTWEGASFVFRGRKGQ
jgi:FG-GAP repeat